MLYTIIKKYIFGRTDWTAEELQFQKNNPQLLEEELAKLHRRFSAMPKDVVAVDSRFTLLERKTVRAAYENNGHRKVKGVIDIPAAVAMALYGGCEYVNTVAVAVFNGDAIDLAVLSVGDCVFEVLAQCWIPRGSDIAGMCSRLMDEVPDGVNIMHLIADKETDFYDVPVLEAALFCHSVKHLNLEALCSKGCNVMSMVRNGELRDILLLEAVSSSIYVECQKRYECVIQTNTTIPTRKAILLDINVDETGEIPLFIRQGNSPNMKDNQLIGTMLLDGLCDTGISGHIEIDVCIDIDIWYGCTVSAKNVFSGKMIQMRI